MDVEEAGHHGGGGGAHRGRGKRAGAGPAGAQASGSQLLGRDPLRVQKTLSRGRIPDILHIRVLYYES